MEKYFTTASGNKVEVLAVPMLLLEDVRTKAMATVQVPPVPTYKVELDEGKFVDYVHDEKSIADDKTTPEEREQWRLYREALARQQVVSANKVMELFIAKGVKLEQPIDPNGEWAELQRFFGVEIPTNPIQLKIHYIKTEILSSPDDINGVIAKVMEASGIDPALLSAARSSFRGYLRQRQNATSGTDGAGDTEEPLDDEPPVSRDGDSESLGVEAERVG